MTEWLIVTDCKSVDFNIYVGSNPAFFKTEGIAKYNVVR